MIKLEFFSRLLRCYCVSHELALPNLPSLTPHPLHLPSQVTPLTPEALTYKMLEIIGLERYRIRYESDSDEVQNLTTVCLS
jgi:hypothetical protein